MPVSFKTLYGIHTFAFVAHLIQGVAVSALVATQDLPSANWPLLNLGYNRVVRDSRYQLAYLVPVFPLLSAINHLAVVAAPTWYEGVLQRQVNPVKFIEYSISAGVMLWLIATLSGMIETRTLIGLMMLNATLQYIGILIELSVAKDGPGNPTVRSLLAVGFQVHLAIWIPLIFSFSTVLGTANPPPPDAVFSIVVVLFILFTSFGMVSGLWAMGVIKDYAVNELNYVILSLVSKSLLTWLLYGGVFSARANDDFTLNTR